MNVRLRANEYRPLRLAAKRGAEPVAEFVRRAIARLVAETLEQRGPKEKEAA